MFCFQRPLFQQQGGHCPCCGFCSFFGTETWNKDDEPVCKRNTMMLFLHLYISITFHNYTHKLGQAGKPYIWSKPMVCWVCCYFFQPIHSLHAGFHVGLLPDCLHKASGNAGTYGLSLHFFPWTMLIYT